VGNATLLNGCLCARTVRIIEALSAALGGDEARCGALDISTETVNNSPIVWITNARATMPVG
jgi:hypothetical protein